VVTFTRADVVYPELGLSHMAEDMAHLIEHQMQGRRSIHVYHAIQPNSHPHIGSVTTLMTTFALARHFAEYFNVPVRITLDALENSPGYAEQKIVDGLVYERSLSDTHQGDRSLAEVYMDSFGLLLDDLAARTGIPYVIRWYREFQALPLIRQQLAHMLRNYDKFAPIVSPSKKRLHVRFPCPTCRYVDKAAVTVRLVQSDPERVILAARCPEHGAHRIELRDDNDAWMDMNTPLRDLAKGMLLIEEWQRTTTLPMTIAGGDWAGMWPLRVFCEGLALLGFPYRGVPPRLFAPIITDWSGAKFSKSLYVRGGAYDYLPRGLVDFSTFQETYGRPGLDKLWSEVQTWVCDPRKLLRNYSIEYFQMILQDDDKDTDDGEQWTTRTGAR
jgi:hypothetical protein